MKQTQKSRLFDLLLERGSQGVYVYEIMTPYPNGLGIAQYGARLLELRRIGWNIKNDHPGHFVLILEPEQVTLPNFA